MNKITNLKTDIKKEMKATKDSRAKVIFGRLLQDARDTGTDFNIQAYSRAPYRYRRVSYEVACHGGHTYTDARGATTLKDRCSIESATNRSHTHTPFGGM
jgi:hypothetical protein